MANKQHDAFRQAAEPISCTRTEAQRRFLMHHVDCVCGAELTIATYVLRNNVKHYRLRCCICQSRTASLPQHLLDCATMALAPEVRSASVSKSRFFCERCDAARTDIYHWAPESFFPDFNLWPTSSLCPACHARWQVGGAGRL